MPERDPSTLPVLRARPGGPAERFAGLLGGSHPAATFFAALVARYGPSGTLWRERPEFFGSKPPYLPLRARQDILVNNPNRLYGFDP